MQLYLQEDVLVSYLDLNICK